MLRKRQSVLVPVIVDAARRPADWARPGRRLWWRLRL